MFSNNNSENGNLNENNSSPINNNNQLQTQPNPTFDDEVDAFLKSNTKYANLPRREGESLTYQFFNDKSKRKLVTKKFTDPVTKQEKVQLKVQYSVIDPTMADQGEKAHQRFPS